MPLGSLWCLSVRIDTCGMAGGSPPFSRSWRSCSFRRPSWRRISGEVTIAEQALIIRLATVAVQALRRKALRAPVVHPLATAPAKATASLAALATPSSV